jgi:hypothetical protein
MYILCQVAIINHLGIACIFHDWKKIEKGEPSDLTFLGGQKAVEPFFSPFLDPLPVYGFL